MARAEKSRHICQQCGFQSPKWLGRCPGCGQWNTLVEEILVRDQTPGGKELLPPATPQPIDGVILEESRRLSSNIVELDRVLGGGVVPGSVVLIGGDPGIGKSTLLLQALNGLTSLEQPILYISGEESTLQIKMRSQRLGVTSSHLYVAAESALENILRIMDELNPARWQWIPSKLHIRPSWNQLRAAWPKCGTVPTVLCTKERKRDCRSFLSAT